MKRRQQGKSVMLWVMATWFLTSVGLASVAEAWQADLAVILGAGAGIRPPVVAHKKEIQMDIEDMISAVQKKLGVQVDGRAGTETWGAIYAHIVKPTIHGAPPAEAIEAVDARSEKKIATLLPEVHPNARALVQKAAQNGIQIKIISGLRSYAEQDELYAQGRTKPGRIVTKVRGGYSNHNFGIAFDVGVFEGTKYLSESDKYKAVGALGMDLGFEWGGNWKTFVDQPHFQLRPEWAMDITESEMLAELRERTENGTPLYA